MDRAPHHSPARSSPSNSPRCEANGRRQPDSSSSVPTLRFPRPDGSRALASWISNSVPNIRMSPEHPSSLSDSAYLVVNSDIDSQDGHTDSVCSLESESQGIGGAHSLLGTDHHEDDENEDAQREKILDTQDHHDGESELADSTHHSESSRRSSSIQYTKEALGTPSPQSGDANCRSIESLPSLDHSIEFDEVAATVRQDGISVKHTIHAFTEKETAGIAQRMAIASPPNRLMGTIRQTMSTNYLETQGPLRVLYTGSLAARHDIIYKISSALTASATTDAMGIMSSSQSNGGIYSIVPISAFGSPSIPEVELMESSAFQIKVENCTTAAEASAEQANAAKDAGGMGYSLILNGERHISLSPSGVPDSPTWELPHLAVFYCTDNDDEEARRTRDATWGAMVSLKVPCLFVCHSLDFDNPPCGQWRGLLGSDPLHVCVESGDADHPIVPERLPIDLSTFLTIDARQMNRNLAYITGLSKGKKAIGRPTRRRLQFKSVPKPLRPLLMELERPEWMTVIYRALLSLILIATGFFVGGYLSLEIPQDASLNIPSPSTQHIPLSQMSTTTATVTVEHTSTRTVEISRPDSSSAPWFFDTRMWSAPDRPIFTASKGANAVLLTIDTEYAHWVPPGRLQVSVHRDTQQVETQITHDGQAVLIELGRQDAHGTLTVRVETTQKPRIREKYEIDFGTPSPFGLFDNPLTYVHNFAMNLAAAANETARTVEHGCGSGVHAFSEAFESARSGSFPLRQQIRDASTMARDASREATASLLETREKLRRRIPSVTEAQKSVDFALRKAQISSKLWWLKMQGRMHEYEEYQRHAVDFMTGKMASLDKLRKDRSPVCKSTEEGAPGGASRFSYLRGQW